MTKFLNFAYMCVCVPISLKNFFICCMLFSCLRDVQVSTGNKPGSIHKKGKEVFDIRFSILQRMHLNKLISSRVGKTLFKENTLNSLRLLLFYLKVVVDKLNILSKT